MYSYDTNYKTFTNIYPHGFSDLPCSTEYLSNVILFLCSY